MAEGLKGKGLDIYIPLLTIYKRKPQQQRFTIRSDVLTSTSSRWRGAVSGLAATTNGLWTRRGSSTDPPMPQPAALWPLSRNVLRQRLTVLVGTNFYSFTSPAGIEG